MDHGYFIEFSSDTVEDAALLVRMGMNFTKDAPSLSVYAGKTQFDAQLLIGRRKNSTTQIQTP